MEEDKKLYETEKTFISVYTEEIEHYETWWEKNLQTLKIKGTVGIILLFGVVPWIIGICVCLWWFIT